MTDRRPGRWLACVALLAPLAGCTNRSDVSLTGSTPAQYSHVWITTQQIWFNGNSTAMPNDGGWFKRNLSTPVTLDLVALGGGTLGSLASALRIAPGTYYQVLLIPVDPSAALTSSAQSAGALYNNEADFVDGSGITHQLPLEILNPAQGLAVQTDVKVPFGRVGLATALAGGLAAGANGTTAGAVGVATTNSGTTGGVGVFSSGSGSGIGTRLGTASSSQPDNSYALAFNGTTDLVPFMYAPGTDGILLSQHASAYDLTQVGGISGQLTLSNITTSTSGLPDITVSAETLSADGSRHVVVANTSVQSDGTFQLYPLAASTGGIDYDVVIHGPGVATIIIKSVTVTLPQSSRGGLFGLRGSATGTGSSSTTGTGSSPGTGTSTGTGTSGTSASNVVAIGTLTPRAASTYDANLSPSQRLPAGSLVQFYQTLNLAGEVPYVIEQDPIDPFSGALFNAQPLSAGTVDSGTWSSGTANVTVVSAAPLEGAGNYSVAASAPAYDDGPLTTRVRAPAAATTQPVLVSLPALGLAAGNASGTLVVGIHQAQPGKYDRGELLVSHGGTLVASATLDGGFAGSGTTVTLNDLPAGTATAVYFLTVRAWNSGNPAASLQVTSYPTLVNMQGSVSASTTLSVN